MTRARDCLIFILTGKSMPWPDELCDDAGQPVVCRGLGGLAAGAEKLRSSQRQGARRGGRSSAPVEALKDLPLVQDAGREQCPVKINLLQAFSSVSQAAHLGLNVGLSSRLRRPNEVQTAFMRELKAARVTPRRRAFAHGHTLLAKPRLGVRTRR